MPKVIPDLPNKLQEAARKILCEEGYQALSIRRVASQCGVAVGTVYNYYREKNDLVAGVMLKDWSVTLADMDAAVAAADDFVPGMEAVCGALQAFIAKNRNIWLQFSHMGGSQMAVTSHHRQLCGQIAERIGALLEKTRQYGLAPCTSLLAELVLAASLREDISAEQTHTLIERIAGSAASPI